MQEEQKVGGAAETRREKGEMVLEIKVCCRVLKSFLAAVVAVMASV